jgi:cold shock CspA family protein
MPAGHVQEFDAHAGTGVIESDEGRPFAFHCTEIADGTRSIEIGTRVEFEVAPGLLGAWEAVAISR